MLQCLSSSLSIFCFLALLFCPSVLWLSVFFCFVLVAVVLVVAHGGGGGGKLGRAEGGWETGGSCCDGGSAAVLLLCSVFLPMSVSVFAYSSISHCAGAVIDDWEDNGNWRWLWWLWQKATVERETERKMLAEPEMNSFLAEFGRNFLHLEHEDQIYL